MKLSGLALAVALGATGCLGLAPAAQAGSSDRYRDRGYYRDYSYYRGRDRDESRRREVLRERVADLADRIRLAERERDISRSEADKFFRRLDDVRDFLRQDQNLTSSEFDRRSNILDDIMRDLRDERREARGRYRGQDVLRDRANRRETVEDVLRGERERRNRRGRY